MSFTCTDWCITRFTLRMQLVCKLRVMCFSRDYTDLFLTLSDDVDDEIQTEHILITDVSQSSGYTLICWSTRGVQGTFSWFHQFIGSGKFTELPKVTENKSSYFGWKSGKDYKDGYIKLTLLREMDTVPIEGVFTCSIGGYFNIHKSEAVSVGLHYPSKLYITNMIASND